MLTAWTREHLKIVSWCYKHAPLRDSWGTSDADHQFEFWCELGRGINDALRRSLDPEFQPAWPR